MKNRKLLSILLLLLAVLIVGGGWLAFRTPNFKWLVSCNEEELVSLVEKKEPRGPFRVGKGLYEMAFISMKEDENGAEFLLDHGKGMEMEVEYRILYRPDGHYYFGKEKPEGEWESDFDVRHNRWERRPSDGSYVEMERLSKKFFLEKTYLSS